MTAIHLAASLHLRSSYAVEHDGDPPPWNFLDGSALVAFAILAEEIVNKLVAEEQ